MRLALVLVLLPALLAGRAATASNTVPSSPAGSGDGAVSGYTVSDVAYSLDGDVLDGVTFTLAPAGATTVSARVAPTEPWSTCAVAGSAASCQLSSDAAVAVSLEIAAAGS